MRIPSIKVDHEETPKPKPDVQQMFAVVPLLKKGEPGALMFTAQEYQDLGMYTQEQTLLTRALTRGETAFGPNSLGLVACLHKLAVCYERQRKYAEAEPLFRRALTIRKKILGADHPETADCMVALADCCGHQGKRTEAESLFKGAIHIYKTAIKTQGPRLNLNLNNCLLNYEDFLRTAHRNADANAIAVRRKALTIDH